jgi:predicted CXXCH cytochrome family protein
LTRNRRDSATRAGSHKRPAGETRAARAADLPSAGNAIAPASKRRGWILPSLAATVLLGLLLGGLAFWSMTGGPHGRTFGGGADSAGAVAFVGSETCAGCHRGEADLWRTSQHKLAMDHATEKSVLGDFNDASFEYYGVQSRFFRKGGKFLVETDGPDGKLATFEVKYTFGVDPLQQYLIDFPDGRRQALSIAWDSRPKEQGGQRWFHLYPNEEIRHDDILHWTKLNQNWNFMCAECHSTGVRKNYDAPGNRFATTWAEISVGCEACHGQGSRHVAWAHAQKSWWPFAKHGDPAKGLVVRFDERRDVVWRPDPRTGNAVRNFTPATLRKEVETCGLCHARRGMFSEDWIPGRPLSDTHFVSPLARGLYHADGQMRDEVYNYGSFKQSKMFAAGVTCGDCHEPHSASLRLSGDSVCLQCHAPEKFAAATHHHHETASAPPGCAACHMPASTYMVIDRRHDHGLRVPRPDLSAKLGIPNACNACHADKSAQWAAAAIESWHEGSRKGWQKYAEAFHAAWSGRADAAALLGAVAADAGAAGFARASALTELASYVSPASINLARSRLSDPDPMVRIAALDMLANAPASQLWQLASPLLADSSRGVRIRAAALLAAVPAASQPAADRARFEAAAAELIAAQRLNADRPEARSMLGNFLARRGQAPEAEAEYKAALRIDPHFTPAAINLADLYRQLGRDGDGEGVLRAAVDASPRDAGAHYALGLALTRLKRADAALEELRLAAEIEPERTRYAYVHAVALHSAGRGSEALAALTGILARHPDDRDALLALISYSRDAGDFATALEYARRLARVAPNDPSLAGLIDDLARRANAPRAP